MKNNLRVKSQNICFVCEASVEIRGMCHHELLSTPAGTDVPLCPPLRPTPGAAPADEQGAPAADPKPLFSPTALDSADFARRASVLALSPPAEHTLPSACLPLTHLTPRPAGRRGASPAPAIIRSASRGPPVDQSGALLKSLLRLRPRPDGTGSEIARLPQELSFEKGFFVVVRAIQLLTAQLPPGRQTLVVGLAGPSGAGKTELSRRLLEFVPLTFIRAWRHPPPASPAESAAFSAHEASQ